MPASEQAIRPMVIGPYQITPCVGRPESVWISNGQGEGGAFPAESFMRALAAGEAAGDALGGVDKFFWEHF